MEENRTRVEAAFIIPWKSHTLLTDADETHESIPVKGVNFTLIRRERVRVRACVCIEFSGKSESDPLRRDRFLYLLIRLVIIRCKQSLMCYSD